MKNIALKRIPNHCTLNKFQPKTCTSIPLVHCFMQPIKNYWLVIANLLQILGPKLFL